MNKIFAIIGMCGSGKTEAVKYFEKNGYQKVYFGSVVLDELKKRKLSVNEKNERVVREDLRKVFGMGVMALKSIDKIRKLYAKGNVVIESLYSWEEFKIIKNEFGESFRLLAIYTNKSLRYKRLGERVLRPLSRLESQSRDYSELENLNKGNPIAFADYTVINNSSLEDLNVQLKNLL
jgi:dephospho-CoA kinase